MIIRLTQKLANKIDSLDVLNDHPVAENPYADWSANLFRVRRLQYIIVTNTTSLYSIFMYGRGITGHDDFIKAARDSMRMYMKYDRKEDLYRSFIEPDNSPAMFAKSLNRSVTGSMNDFIRGAKYHLEYDGLSLFDTAQRINMTPQLNFKYFDPTEAFAAMAQDSSFL